MKGEPDQEGFLLEQERSRFLPHIRNLGIHKCLGYLPVDSMEKDLHISVEEEIRHAKESGLTPVLLSAEEIGMRRGGGALFVYEPLVLSQILKENHDVLKQHGWPVDAEGFVRRVAKERVFEDRKDLLHLIQKIFGDAESL